MGEAAGQDGAHVMSKEEFLAELEACLSDLSKEEQRPCVLPGLSGRGGDEPDKCSRHAAAVVRMASGWVLNRMWMLGSLPSPVTVTGGWRRRRYLGPLYGADERSEQDSGKTSKDHSAEEATEKKTAISGAANDLNLPAGRHARPGKRQNRMALENGQKQAWNDAKTGEWGAGRKMPGKQVRGRRTKRKDNENGADDGRPQKEQPWHFIAILLILFGIPAAAILEPVFHLLQRSWRTA